MNDLGLPPRASRTDPRAEAGRPPPGPARRSVHVHATPTAAIAEMDGRRRDMEAWLADARRRTGTAAAEAPRGAVRIPGEPRPELSRFSEETPPAGLPAIPRPGADEVGPVAIPTGLPGGPPDVPGPA